MHDSLIPEIIFKVFLFGISHIVAIMATIVYHRLVRNNLAFVPSQIWRIMVPDAVTHGRILSLKILFLVYLLRILRSYNGVCEQCWVAKTVGLAFDCLLLECISKLAGIINFHVYEIPEFLLCGFHCFYKIKLRTDFLLNQIREYFFPFEQVWLKGF